MTSPTLPRSWTTKVVGVTFADDYPDNLAKAIYEGGDGMMGWLKRRRCPHARQRGIYGDEINSAGGKRARCLDCGKLLPHLPGPGAAAPPSR